MKDDLSKFLPLSPAALHILLALAGEDMHGYGIMQEVARQSEGAYKLGPGTLYDNLQRLMDQGMVDGDFERRSPPAHLPPQFAGAKSADGGNLAPGRRGSRGALALAEVLLMRRIYILLLYLHPRPFRQRFGDEMLGDLRRLL